MREGEGRKEKEEEECCIQKMVLFFLHETLCDRKGQLLLKLSIELR